MNRKEMAVMLHGKGFNCAQSVACAFCHVMGADPEQVFKHAEAFGFGYMRGGFSHGSCHRHETQRR